MNPDGVDAYLRFWTTELSPDDLQPRVAAITTEDVAFTDPFNAVAGRDSFARIVEEMFARCRNPRFTIEDRAVGADAVFTRWRFAFETKTDKAVRFDGVSALRFDANGLCARHEDFWDSQHVYGLVPGLGGLIRLVRRKLAV